jgi:hypothetical protein
VCNLPTRPVQCLAEQGPQFQIRRCTGSGTALLYLPDALQFERVVLQLESGLVAIGVGLTRVSGLQRCDSSVIPL